MQLSTVGPRVDRGDQFGVPGAQFMVVVLAGER